VGLGLRKEEALLQTQFRVRHILAGLDEGHHLVDVRQRNHEAFEDVRPLLGLAQFKPRAPRHHLHPVFHEVVNEFLEVEGLGLAAHQRKVDDAEG